MVPGSARVCISCWAQTLTAHWPQLAIAGLCPVFLPTSLRAAGQMGHVLLKATTEAKKGKVHLPPLLNLPSQQLPAPGPNQSHGQLQGQSAARQPALERERAKVNVLQPHFPPLGSPGRRGRPISLRFGLVLSHHLFVRDLAISVKTHFSRHHPHPVPCTQHSVISNRHAGEGGLAAFTWAHE